jgi:hypothetical protein
MDDLDLDVSTEVHVVFLFGLFFTTLIISPIIYIYFVEDKKYKKNDYYQNDLDAFYCINETQI